MAATTGAPFELGAEEETEILDFGLLFQEIEDFLYTWAQVTGREKAQSFYPVDVIGKSGNILGVPQVRFCLSLYSYSSTKPIPKYLIPELLNDSLS